jgi:hypothetical protein
MDDTSGTCRKSCHYTIRLLYRSIHNVSCFDTSLTSYAISYYSNEGTVKHK